MEQEQCVEEGRVAMPLESFHALAGGKKITTCLKKRLIFRIKYRFTVKMQLPASLVIGISCHVPTEVSSSV